MEMKKVWFNDLREFLSVCEDIDKVRVLKGVNWQDEMGMLVEAMAEKRGPILLFDDIPGYSSGFRVMGNAFHTLARTALADEITHQKKWHRAAEFMASLGERISTPYR